MHCTGTCEKRNVRIKEEKERDPCITQSPWADLERPGTNSSSSHRLSLSLALSRNSFREQWCFPASHRGDKAARVSLVLAASQLTPLTGRFDLGLSRPNPVPGLLCQPHPHLSLGKRAFQKVSSKRDRLLPVPS